MRPGLEEESEMFWLPGRRDRTTLSNPCRAASLLTDAKTVQFLNGSDGEPWVWVMGEHDDDLSIEQILEREAREKARKQAELEAQQLRLVPYPPQAPNHLDLGKGLFGDFLAVIPGGH